MAQTIHVIEPTLEDEAGHGRSFMAAMMAAGLDQRFEIWAGKRAGELFEDLPKASLHPHFVRRIRRLQAFFLVRKLLKGADRIFWPTADRRKIAAIMSLPSNARTPKTVVMGYLLIPAIRRSP